MSLPDIGDFKREPVGVSYRGLIVLLAVRKSVRIYIVEITQHSRYASSGTWQAELTFDECRQPMGSDTPLDPLRQYEVVPFGCGHLWQTCNLQGVGPSMWSHNFIDAKPFDATVNSSVKHGLLACLQSLSRCQTCMFAAFIVLKAEGCRITPI
jgi:hypothetical protein